MVYARFQDPTPPIESDFTDMEVIESVGGDLMWRQDSHLGRSASWDELFYGGGTVLHGGFELLASDGGTPTGNNDDVVIGLDPETGSVKWDIENFEVDNRGERITYVDDEEVFIISQESQVFTVDAETGEILYTIRSDDGLTQLGSIDGDVIGIEIASGLLLRLSVEGEVVWSKDLSSHGVVDLIYTNEYVYVHSESEEDLIQLDIETGLEEDTFFGLGDINDVREIIVRDGKIYVDEDDLSGNPRVRAIDEATFNVDWLYEYASNYEGVSMDVLDNDLVIGLAHTLLFNGEVSIVDIATGDETDVITLNDRPKKIQVENRLLYTITEDQIREYNLDNVDGEIEKLWEDTESSLGSFVVSEDTVFATDGVEVVAWEGSQFATPFIEGLDEEDEQLRPRIDLSPSNTVVNEDIIFDGNQSKSPHGDIVDYRWSIDEGPVIRGSSTQETFADPGLHKIELEIEDEHGNLGNTAVNFYVADALGDEAGVPEPDIELSSYSIDRAGQIQFIGSGSTGDNSITQYNWEVNGYTFTGETVTLDIFQDAGLHNVKLEVVDTQGQSRETFSLFEVEDNILDITEIIEADVEEDEDHTDIARIFLRRGVLDDVPEPGIREGVTEVLLLEESEDSEEDALFGGIVDNKDKRGASIEIIAESFEGYAKKAPPSDAVENLSTSDAGLAFEAIIDTIDYLTVGEIEGQTGLAPLTFSSDSQAKKIRQIERVTGWSVVYNPDKRVDFVSDRGQDKTNIIVSPDSQNIDGQPEIEELGGQDDYVTHIRVLGSGEGQHQIQAERVVDWYVGDLPESWHVETKKEINTQEAVDQYADTLKEDYNVEQHIEVSATIVNVDVEVGDIFTVEYLEEDIEQQPMEVVELKKEYRPNGIHYDAVLSTRTETRRSLDERQREDTESYNSAIDGNASPINAGGGRQPVDVTHDYTMRLYYPDEVFFEHRLNVRLIGMPYRAYSSGAAVAGGEHIHAVDVPFSNLNHAHGVSVSGLAHKHGIDDTLFSHGHTLSNSEIDQILSLSGLDRTLTDIRNEDLVTTAQQVPIESEVDLSDTGDSDVGVYVHGSFVAGTMRTGGDLIEAEVTVQDVEFVSGGDNVITDIGSSIVKVEDGENFSTTITVPREDRLEGILGIKIDATDNGESTDPIVLEVKNATATLSVLGDKDEAIDVASGDMNVDQQTFSNLETTEYSGASVSVDQETFNDEEIFTKEEAGDVDAPPDPGIVETFSGEKFYPTDCQIIINGEPLGEESTTWYDDGDIDGNITWTEDEIGDVEVLDTTSGGTEVKRIDLIVTSN